MNAKLFTNVPAVNRREFMRLLRNAKTQERVAHTLKTGKPLRN